MEIRTLKELQNKFNEILESVPNKLNLINNEIKQVELYLDFKPTKKHFKSFENGFINEPKPSKIFEINVVDMSRDLFTNAFNGFNLYGDFKKERGRFDNDQFYKHTQQVIIQADEFSKYYQYLFDLKNESIGKNHPKKSTLTHPQKLLALYYLGIDMSNFYNNVQSAKILSLILDLDESNTKDYLTYFEGKKAKVKNKKNIDKMIELFEHQDFKSILDKIKEES